MLLTEIHSNSKKILTLIIYFIVNIVHYAVLYFSFKNTDSPTETLISFKYIVMYLLNIVFYISLIFLLYKDSFITSNNYNEEYEQNKAKEEEKEDNQKVTSYTINNINNKDKVNEEQVKYFSKSMNTRREGLIKNLYDIEKTNSKEIPHNEFCSICFIGFPLRTRHCHECDKCVVGYDHHCYFLSICIGEKNKVHFLFFIFISSCFILSIIVILLSNSVNLISNSNEDIANVETHNITMIDNDINHEIDSFIYINNLKSYIFYNSIVFIPLLIYSQVFIYLISLLKFTFLMIFKNITSCEYYSWHKIDYITEEFNGSSVFSIEEGRFSNIKLLFEEYRNGIIQKNQKSGSLFHDIDWGKYLKREV